MSHLDFYSSLLLADLDIHSQSDGATWNKKTAIAKQIMHKKPPSILVAKESPFCHFSYFVFAGNFLLLFSWSLVTNFLKFLFDRRSLPIMRRECSPLTSAEKVKSDV